MKREVHSNSEGTAHGHNISSKFLNTKIYNDKLTMIPGFRLGLFLFSFFFGGGGGGRDEI